MRSAKDRKNAKVAVQSYTKTAAHLDRLGEQARKLRQEMADATDAVADTREELKGYNERRREQTAELKEILTPIVRHLQAGGTANGVTGLHNWAAWYNPTAKDGKNAARQIMRIVNAPEPGDGEGDIKSPIHLNLDKLTKEMESGRKVMLTSGNFKYELIKTPFLNKTTITLSIADTRPDEVVVKKTTEEKKPVKHAKRPKVGGSWCGKGLTNNNAASQNRYATCPFCIAAMAADIPVQHPETWSRHYTKDLKETRKLLVNAEKHATADSETYAGYTVPELKEKIAELEAKLTAIKEVKTPEQAVAAAKAAAAQKEEDRKTDAAMRAVRDSLRQCDDSVVWFQEYREALIAAKQPTWVSKIYNAALREIEQDIRHVEDAAKRKVEREAHQAADNERYEKGRARIAEINQQDFMKRYKAAKRLAKHYIELFKEYDTVKEIYHGNAYMHLLELYPNLATSNTRPYGIQKINLPMTEKAFFADHAKALADFNTVLQEGIDKGWMTTEPRTPAVPLESLDNCPTEGEVV